MKVVHILKRIELFDDDVKDLRKLEKMLKRNKSFSTPIYLSIEKQINILLGERIKLLDLKIENPPDYLVKEIEGEEVVQEIEVPIKKSTPKKTKIKKAKSRDSSAKKDESFEEKIAMLTQDQIDEKFNLLKESRDSKVEANHMDSEEDVSDESIKLIDLALEKGTLNKSEIEKEKKRIRFFKDNFPGEE